MEPYKIGITGTRFGITGKQRQAVREHLSENIGAEIHHGDCVGADAQVHFIADLLQHPIVIHPPIKPNHRAFLKKAKILEPKEYLERNKDIVDVCDELLVLPQQKTEQLRSGTWSTYRYARKIGKPYKIIYPDGVILSEGLLV